MHYTVLARLLLVVALVSPAATLRMNFRPALPRLAPRLASRAPLQLTMQADGGGQEYSQATRLRAEIESPFAKVRLFLFPALFLAAGIATYFAGTALLAEFVGARPPAEDTLLNLGVDVAALAGLGALWAREAKSADARLKRIGRGAALASLRVQLLGGSKRNVELSSLRKRSDGVATESKRVVIVAAGEQALSAALAEAAAVGAELAAADFLLVPLLLTPAAGGGAEPTIQLPSSAAVELGAAGGKSAGSAFLALPQALERWQQVLGDELKTAQAQAENIGDRGLTLVLKKNGRVGTRRLGTPDYAGLLADYSSRAAAGLDTTNI